MENKSSVIVAALVFLKHKGLCGWLADSNYFYRGVNAMHKFLCMRKAICMHITYMVETVQVIGEGLIKSSFLAVIITPLPFLFLTSYSFYTQVMLILNFNWCSVFTECYFYLRKRFIWSKSLLRFLWPNKKFSQQNFSFPLLEGISPPLNTI